MKKTVLVTGGAGLVGSHLVDRLIDNGNKVIIYDNLEPQIHQGKLPDYINKKAEFIHADIRDRQKLTEAIKRVDIISHQAAAVGVGQSMYEIERYVDVNCHGTALIFDILAKEKNKVKKVIIASSMTNYGEGKYYCDKCDLYDSTPRSLEQLQKHVWEKVCPKCENSMKPLGTDENKLMEPTSLYALTKKMQEEMGIMLGKTYNIPVVALRYFNIYGPRQAVSNPYTGVVAIFSSSLLNDNAPLIFEDGFQSRNMIHVTDIVQANILAMEKSEADYQALNVGADKSYTILEIANMIAEILGKDIKPAIVNKFRQGDVRHCYADVEKAKKLLGFEAKVDLKEGLKELLGWLKTQDAVDNISQARKELEERGLVI